MEKIKVTGNITPTKIVAFCILVVGALALYQEAQEVSYLAILASAGLLGWRKHEQRKIITKNGQ